MRQPGWNRLALVVVALTVATGGLPTAGRADEDNDNAGPAVESKPGADLRVEYLGWSTPQPGLIRFKVTNVGSAPSTATTGRGETLSPPPSQETAPPVPALAPGASFEIPYLVFPAEACDNHRVRMAVPLANDRNAKDNVVEIQICDKYGEPDLRLEYLGMVVGGNDQLLSFKVTNVGGRASAATTARVETIAPLPAQVSSPSIPALAPGSSVELQYALAGSTGCDNHTIKASVPLAQDSFPPNNTRQMQICGPKPSPWDDLVVGPAPRVIEIPEHARSGDHTVDVRPKTVRSYLMDRYPEPGACGPLPFFPSYVAVGWYQEEVKRESFPFDIRDCAYAAEAQTAVTWNYTLLDEVPDIRVTRVDLIFKEIKGFWRDPAERPGCVATVGVATEFWDAPNLDFRPIRSRDYRSTTPQSPTMIDVRSEVIREVLNQKPRYGFVLRGSFGVNDLEARGRSSCFSLLEDLHLRVSYVVL